MTKILDLTKKLQSILYIVTIEKWANGSVKAVVNHVGDSKKDKTEFAWALYRAADLFALECGYDDEVYRAKVKGETPKTD
jgi:hypothetical protein